MALGPQFDQLKALLTAFGEHDYPESTAPKDPEGNVLSHEHNMPIQYRHDLAPYQKIMVDESGVRQLNSMQQFQGKA